MVRNAVPSSLIVLLAFASCSSGGESAGRDGGDSFQARGDEDFAACAAILGQIPVAACADVGRADCFSNYDCAQDERCQNLGTAPEFVPCCIPCPRGTTAAGETCDEATGELTCASGICISDGEAALCSMPCDVEPCPVNLPECVTFPFSESPQPWCFPS